MNTEKLKTGAIGFLLASTVFLLTGQQSAPSTNAYRYQLVPNDSILFVFDTKTGTTKFVTGLEVFKSCLGLPFDEIPDQPVAASQLSRPPMR